jgi:endonuclease YncB( thermonuclease family)
MSRRRLRQLVTVVATLALAAAAAWLRHEGTGHGGFPPSRRSSATPAPTAAWTELRRPSLAEGPADDGDSFTVRHADGEDVVRLYFVDCPEKRRHQHNRERLAEQGAAFGGLSESDTLRIGRAARDFTLTLLRDRPFRVVTRWEQVFDDRRHYAHVFVTQPDGTERPLPELLVDAGLARIHTRGADLPDGTRRARFEHNLRSLEKSARLAGRGGWAQFAAQNAARDD